MNKLIVTGNLTKDVELAKTEKGTSFVRFTLGSPRRFVDKESGERKADFIEFIAWSKTAETIATYTHKGMRIGVIARIESGQYVKDGKTVYTESKVVEEFEFLEKKSETAVEEPLVVDVGDGNKIEVSAKDVDREVELKDPFADAKPVTDETKKYPF